jgi:LacI family transcriptional regulator
VTITIRDIAKKLNLSIGAVSRALDGYADISEETRQKVVQAAQEMGYVPNQAARQLRRRKADAVGYILPAHTPRFSDPFFTEFLAGLADETAVHPFDLLISIAPPGDKAEKQIYRNWVQGHKVDGIILTHMHLHDWRARFLLENKVHFTALENSLDGLDFPRIEVNREQGMVALISHLAGRGFKRIAYLGGPIELTIEMAQFEGYRRGLEANRIPFDANIIASGDLTSTGGYQSARSLLSLPDPPDAIVCINDETAFGVLHAAHELGRQIGKNLAVAGFDGVQASKHTEPSLTSLDIPVYDVARQLVKMLVAEITQQPIAERIVKLPPELLIRASTGG